MRQFLIYTLSNEYRLRSNFREGLAGIANIGAEEPYEGYIDQNGTVVIPLEKYSSQGRFRNGRVSIPDKLITDKDIHYGVIDRLGTLIYPFTLDKRVEFTDRVASAVQDGRFGAIDIEGNVVVTFEYDDVKTGDGVVCALRKGKSACLNTEVITWER